MNSLLQQFYMIPSFRNDILSVQKPNKGVNPEEDMLFQIQHLFSELNESVKQFYNPKLFCHAFKDWEGNSINVLEQMDVDEFFNLFLDKMEQEIKGTPQENSIKYHFGGIFANQIICKDCPHSSMREEPFLAINLQIKNKRSLQQCLESFVQGEMLEGNNAYHCEKCDKKVPSLKRVCIKRLPRYLICVLKRFDINYDTMLKYKLNEYCEFPIKLNMESYTVEGLAKKDREKEKEKAIKEGRDFEEDNRKPNQQKSQYPPEYYEYKLTGVLIHLGTADTGHYYSLIMDREKTWIPEKERWYEFNDINVQNYDPEEIRNDAFGGEERLNGNSRLIDKIKNAYLLVYERVFPYESPENEDNKDIKQREKIRKPKEETTIPDEIHTAIQVENEKYWYNKYMFHEDYFSFVKSLCLSWNSAENILLSYPSKNCDYSLFNLNDEFQRKHSLQTYDIKENMSNEASIAINDKGLDILIFKYGITVLLTTLFRAKTRDMVPDLMDFSKACINKHLEAGQWLLLQFTNTKVIYELLLECPEVDIRRFTVGLLYCAMLKVYENEKDRIADWIPGSNFHLLLPNFANCIMCQLEGCRKFTKNFEHFFQVIGRLAFLGPEMRDYFYKTGALTRLIGFWNLIPETNWNNFANIATFPKNNEPELGIPTEVDERFQSVFEEINEKKRELINLQAQPNYTFFLEAVSILLRGTVFDEKSISPPHALQRSKSPQCDKLKTLLLNSKLLGDMMTDCRKNLSLNSIIQCFQYLSWNNSEFKNAWLKAIIEQIVEKDEDKIRTYYYFLEALLNVEDAERKQFIDRAFTHILSMMEQHCHLYYMTVYSINQIILMANQNKSVLAWFSGNFPKWQWLIEYIKNNLTPPLKYDPHSIIPFKTYDSNVNYFHQQVSSAMLKKYKESGEQTIKCLISMKEGILYHKSFRESCKSRSRARHLLWNILFKNF